MGLRNRNDIPDGEVVHGVIVFVVRIGGGLQSGDVLLLHD